MASAAQRWATKALDSSLGARSVRVLVRPSPITFSERRAVLEVLQNHGPIEMFRMTPGHYGSFISITKSQKTASKLFAASPLAYTLDTDRTTFSESEKMLPKTSGGSKPTSKSEPDGREQKHFTLEIFPAQDYNHEKTFSRVPEHGPWPASYTNKTSFMAAILEETLPNDVAAKGLARWDNHALDPESDKLAHRSNRIMIESWMPSVIKTSGKS